MIENAAWKKRKERNTQLLRNQRQEAMLLKVQQMAAACCKIKTNTATMPDLRTAIHYFKSLSKDSIQKQQKKKKKFKYGKQSSLFSQKLWRIFSNSTKLNFTQCKNSSQQTSVNLKQSRISTPFKHFGTHQESYQDCDM